MLDDIQFTIYLIRHGQSETNVDPDLMGQTPDVLLTELGRRQAALLHNRFVRESIFFDKIYSSDYTRAFDTAAIVKGDNSQPIILAEELREYDAGDWTHHSRRETLTTAIKLRMSFLNHNFLPPNGESLTQVERRASKWLEDTILYNKEMIDLSDWKRKNEHSPLSIACFSHGMTIKCILQYIMGFDKSITWKVSIDNTSVTKLSFGKEGWRIHYINDHAHC